MAASSENTNKDHDLCRAAGGVCKTIASCIPHDALLSGQLCKVHNLICCRHTANREAPEERKVRRRKRATVIKKNSYLIIKKKSNSKKFNTNGNTWYKVFNKEKSKQGEQLTENSKHKRKPINMFSETIKKIKNTPKEANSNVGKMKNMKTKKMVTQFKSGSASKTSMNMKKKKKKKKGCKKTAKCSKRGGYCRKRNKGCRKGEKGKNNLCTKQKCKCCIKFIPPTPPPPIICQNKTRCTDENGICVPRYDDCSTGFTVDYVLCSSSYCKCCKGPTPIVNPGPVITPISLIRYPECPKAPDENSLTCLTCGIANGPQDGRVYGGVKVNTANKYPWLVWLQYGNIHWCGGSILNSLFVLTAAQCLYVSCALLPAQSISVIIADHNRTSKLDDVQGITCTVKAQELTPHPDYQACSINLHEHDIALIKLSAPLSLATDNVLRPICLPTSNDDTHQGVSAIIAGWGKTSITSDYPDLPHEINISVIQTSSCKKFSYWTDDYMLCAGATNQHKDACAGDAGGPLIAAVAQGRYSVIGIVSGGDPQCKGPGVYTRVNKYLDWIKNIADLSNICPVI